MAAIHDRVRRLALDLEARVQNQVMTDDQIDGVIEDYTFQTEDGDNRVNLLDVAIEYCRAARQKNVDKTPERSKQIDFRITTLQQMQVQADRYIVDPGDTGGSTGGGGGTSSGDINRAIATHASDIDAHHAPVNISGKADAAALTQEVTDRQTADTQLSNAINQVQRNLETGLATKENTITDGSIGTSELADGSVTERKLAQEVIDQLGGSGPTGGQTAAQVRAAIATHASDVDAHHEPVDISGKADASALASTQSEVTNNATSIETLTQGLAGVRRSIADIPGNGTIGEAALQDGAVTENKIANGAVTVNKLGDGAVTARKLGTNAVTSGKIADAAVTEDKIENNAVTSLKIPADTINNGHLRDNAVNTDEIAANAVTEVKLSADVRTKLNASRGTTDLSAYRTSADQDVIDDRQNTAIGLKADSSDVAAVTARVADIERDFLFEPNYWLSTADARTFIVHLNSGEAPSGATRIRLVVGGTPFTQTITAGDTDYAFDVTALVAASIRQNLRGATTITLNLQYLDATQVLATQRILLRVLASDPDAGFIFVRKANAAALSATVPEGTVEWYPE